MASSPEKQNRLIKVEMGSSTKTTDTLPGAINQHWHGSQPTIRTLERHTRRCAPAIVCAMGKMPHGRRHTELPLAALATRALAWMSGPDETFDHRGANADLSTRVAATPTPALGL